jgi:hypothetical protein
MMKKILFTLLLFTALQACNNQPATEKPAIPDHTQLVKAYFEHFNKHEWSKIAAMYSDTAEFKDPSLGPGIVKQLRQQTIDKYTALNQIFPDIHDSVVNTYPSGDHHIVVEFISTGTAPDHSKFELPICTIFTINNGLITADFTYYDNFEEEKAGK